MCCFLICYMYSRHESQYCTTTNAKVPATFMCGTGTALAGYWVEILVRNHVPPSGPWNHPNPPPPFLPRWISGLPHPNWVRRPLCELVRSPCVLMDFLQVLRDSKMSGTSCDLVNFKHVTNGMSWSCIKPKVTSQPHPGPSPKGANHLRHPKKE